MKVQVYKTSILLIGLLHLNDSVYSQGKFEISGEIGFPEAAAIKLNMVD